MIYKIVSICLTTYLLFSCTRNVETVEKYYSDGTLMESYQMVEQGVRVGKYIFNYNNGQPKARGQFEDGLMVGKWEYYYQNGNIQSIQKLEQGKLLRIDSWDSTGLPEVIAGHGTAKLFYPNGQIKNAINYFDNERHGITRTWYENGQQESLQHFERGEPRGVWCFWDEEGLLLRQQNYDE